jgi:hypothetical protein
MLDVRAECRRTGRGAVVHHETCCSITMHPDLLRQEHMLPSRSLSWRLCAIVRPRWRHGERGPDAEMLHGSHVFAASKCSCLARLV